MGNYEHSGRAEYLAKNDLVKWTTLLSGVADMSAEDRLYILGMTRKVLDLIDTHCEIDNQHAKIYKLRAKATSLQAQSWSSDLVDTLWEIERSCKKVVTLLQSLAKPDPVFFSANELQDADHDHRVAKALAVSAELASP